ncbi:unnamed protein product [Linum tenue]|uniref:Uncharacterized protein n=1 Tax=Linum tenue TaxID=586396 RepID=A0AAV0PQW8_9ROSI|nr:unnamed protein product [Linum tenue]
MGVIAKEVKAMSQNEILEFEKVGELTIKMHCLKLTDIKVRREFKRPDALTEKEMDAAGDGDVLVVLDLRPDESLFEAGFAREVVNRIQKLRKKLALDPTDAVDVYIESLKENSTLQRVLDSQIRVDSIENLPPVELELGRHFHLNVGDHFVATRMQLG